MGSSDASSLAGATSNIGLERSNSFLTSLYPKGEENLTNKKNED